MYIVEEMKNMNSKQLVDNWEKLTMDCGSVQKRVLMEILKAGENTVIGRKYDFSKIKSIEDFRNTFPETEYDFYEEYIDHMANGEDDFLFAGKTKTFLKTSGTTGKSKMIPESELSGIAKNNVVALRGTYLFMTMAKMPKFHKWMEYKGLKIENLNISELINNCKLFMIASIPNPEKTAGGIPLTFASGSTVENSGINQALSYPLPLLQIKDTDANSYLTMLFSLKNKDVIGVLGNNAANFKGKIDLVMENAQTMINDIRTGKVTDIINLLPEEKELVNGLFTADIERADELQRILDTGKENFIPKNYWPFMMICGFWLSSSVGHNIKDIKPCFDDDICFMDVGYGASEGKLNIPYKPGVKEGTLAIASAFYEFKDIESGNIYTADEVEVGKKYELIVTTFGGLYRYDMHDIVQINGVKGNSPDIEFISKSGEILNLSQEKIPAVCVIEYLREIIKSQNNSLIQAQIYPDLDTKNYKIYLECEKSISNEKEDIIIELEKRISEGFEVYGFERSKRIIYRPELIEMKEGWKASLYEEKLKTGSPMAQIKLKSMIDCEPLEKWIM